LIHENVTVSWHSHSTLLPQQIPHAREVLVNKTLSIQSHLNY